MGILSLLNVDALAWLLAGAVGAVAAIWGLVIKAKREGDQNAKNEGMRKDHENAGHIADRVDRNRAEQLPKLDNAGYRD